MAVQRNCLKSTGFRFVKEDTTGGLMVLF